MKAFGECTLVAYQAHNLGVRSEAEKKKGWQDASSRVER
jgi:hypothetical protein